jgi:hypothetical protein
MVEHVILQWTFEHWLEMQNPNDEDLDKALPK